jgi:hypothetical protein
VATNGQTCGQQRERKTHNRKKYVALILCESLWALLVLKRRIERGWDTMTYKIVKVKEILAMWDTLTICPDK